MTTEEILELLHDVAARVITPRFRALTAGPPRAETPEEILDRRFARGEIDGEAYQRMRTEITSARTGRR